LAGSIPKCEGLFEVLPRLRIVTQIEIHLAQVKISVGKLRIELHCVLVERQGSFCSLFVEHLASEAPGLQGFERRGCDLRKWYIELLNVGQRLS